MNRGTTIIIVCCVLALSVLFAAGDFCAAQKSDGTGAFPTVNNTVPEISPGQVKQEKAENDAFPDSVVKAAQRPGSFTDPPDSRSVAIDFNNVDIILFIKYISELTGKNFVIDKAVRGNVSIISPVKISIDEAYRVFESVLEVQGYTTVPAGSVIKIVPAVAARSKGVVTGLRPGDADSDKVVTQLIPLQYADPKGVMKLIVPLVSKTSIVASYPPTGMLIVTDVHSNINRLLKIIKEVDVPAIGEDISVVTLRYASAAEVAKTVSTLFKSAGSTLNKSRAGFIADIKVLADDRTNSLIILAGKAETARINELVALLDREIPRSSGDNHVYYLQNANAEDLAKVLTSLPSKDGQAPAMGKQPVISKNVRIVADKATNSLVITAGERDYLALEDVIKKLDIPRRMVYIEALIMEVNVEKDFRLGVELKGGFTYNGGKQGVFFGSKGSETSTLGGLVAGTQSNLPRGLSVGVLGNIITIGNQSFPGIGAVLEAYKGDADVHIVSTPQILTTDNEEAEIKVGENVPYLTKEASGDQNYQTYEYKDVGVTLRITPQINQEGMVRLKIFQEIIKLKSSVDFKPTTLRRSARTTVIVQDNNTVVLGGIIGDDVDEQIKKVPVLGDIPVLGWLFKTKSNKRTKTNLYIFLTPHIVRNPVEAQQIFRQKKEELKQGRLFDKKYSLDRGAAPKSAEPLSPADDMSLAEQGFRKLQAHEYAKAREYLEQSLAVNPDNPIALINMGIVYEVEGSPDLAVGMYERVLELNPAGRAVASTKPELVGQSLVEVARDNLDNIRQRNGK